MALEGDRLSILMADCGDDLVPPGDDPAAGANTTPTSSMRWPTMHAHFLGPDLAGWHDDLGLQDLSRRWLFFAPDTIAPELEAADVPGPIAVAHQGWGLLPERAPRLDELVRAVHRDPEPLSDALRATPLTFVGGDWKLGNVGHRPDGRTILLDWAYPGEAPPCWDLTWYLALNRARLPESKEATIARYRERARGAWRRHHRLVGPPAGAELRRHGRGLRVGEGGRRPGRARLVGAGGPGRSPVALRR